VRNYTDQILVLISLAETLIGSMVMRVHLADADRRRYLLITRDSSYHLATVNRKPQHRRFRSRCWYTRARARARSPN